MRRCLITLTLLLASLGAHADELTTQIQQQLSDAPVLRGEFVQTRELTGLKKPLKSSGRMLVDKTRGVLWKTEKPIAGTLRVSRQEIVQKDGQQILMRLSAEKEPVVKTIGSVLFSLFAGDLATLDRYFSHTGSLQRRDGQRGWELQLTPREPALAHLIQRIELKGAGTAEEVVLRAESGDLTRIEFRHIATARTLTAPEVAEFE
ncbi:MAG: outer membrane lipoprotein carrier protein LolA [Formivibrio sp.]|nr:outer membrane lipoprotein carrier protein LolA [Formivibrio sp.]